MKLLDYNNVPPVNKMNAFVIYYNMIDFHWGKKLPGSSESMKMESKEGNLKLENVTQLPETVVLTNLI